ncbi:hypothetical protein [Cellvibrio mixtus]|uniref:hypothetical protein n=1 Tax=Cellvibrio mixtus TaxID=39650 RepID=UPI000AFD2947|nr:hypothetical protein [Cellvibrio mixtus]
MAKQKAFCSSKQEQHFPIAGEILEDIEPATNEVISLKSLKGLMKFIAHNKQ